MGLDMYLNRKTYVSTYGERPEGFRVCVPGVDESKVTEITERMAYWRKANAIHAWFVANVQDGEDDCREYEVSMEDLVTLRDLCQRIIDSSPMVSAMVANGERFENGEWTPILEAGQVMENPALAQELLPTQSGFFFGSTDYDQWYMQDLRDTIDQFTPIIDAGGSGWFEYHSSW